MNKKCIPVLKLSGEGVISKGTCQDNHKNLYKHALLQRDGEVKKFNERNTAVTYLLITDYMK